MLMMTCGQPTTIFIFKFVRFVSDGFLFDLEACLINLKLPYILLICSDALKGDFGGLERFNLDGYLDGSGRLSSRISSNSPFISDVLERKVG